MAQKWLNIVEDQVKNNSLNHLLDWNHEVRYYERIQTGFSIAIHIKYEGGALISSSSCKVAMPSFFRQPSCAMAETRARMKTFPCAFTRSSDACLLLHHTILSDPRLAVLWIESSEASSHLEHAEGASSRGVCG